ncbi:MAG TPA: hypothetical protein PLF31_00070 [Candidatus Paceibacterota bacterium]|nr:hypothetical protein [Candidatus Paceibacterota bacterium]
MKLYLRTIKILQTAFLGISILLMLTLPLLLVFRPELITDKTILWLYGISHLAVFFVMCIRPLADLFRGTTLIRPLVILRKEVGVLSASIIVSFILSKTIVDPFGYIASLGTFPYWSMTNFALFAHLADVSAVILIVTSNNLSKKVLGGWWKKIQKLSYVYFYASSLYVLLVLTDYWMLLSMFIVTTLTVLAYVKNKEMRNLRAQAL